MFLSRLRLLTAGESHGPLLTGILEGMPAGLPLDAGRLDHDLARRQRGFGAGARMQIERDHARLTAGVMAGATTGAPIAFTIENRDHRHWAGRDIAPMTVPRPGHADLTSAIKYGYRDLRLGLERASARETAVRVAAGAICRALLVEFGITIGGYVTSIGTARMAAAPVPVDPALFTARFAAAEADDVRCPDPALAAAMRTEIEAAIAAKDTLGGIVEVAALHVPPGLGSHVHGDKKLDARLAGALLGVPAVKAVEFGEGFAATQRRGTAVQDELFLDGDAIVRRSNHAGGIEGGISNGAPIVARIAVKPIATTLTPQASVDLATGRPAATRYERSDFCQVPRAVPIAEAMVALVLADALLDKLGGDALAELRARFAALRQARVSELPMDAQPWRFGYES
jgi:chorismate synthase